MTNKQDKVKNCMMVLVCLAVSMVLIGCGVENRSSTMASKQFFSMSLNSLSEYQPLLTGKPQTCGMRSGRVYLKPGEECGQHSTKAHEETLVFLSGKGTAFISEKETAFEVGQSKICYIPPNTFHNVKNTGDLPLVYIYCVAPVSPAVAARADEHQHQH